MGRSSISSGTNSNMRSSSSSPNASATSSEIESNVSPRENVQSRRVRGYEAIPHSETVFDNEDEEEQQEKNEEDNVKNKGENVTY